MKRKLAIMFGLLLVMGATLPIGLARADSLPIAKYIAAGDSLAVGVGTIAQKKFGYAGLFGHYLNVTQPGPDVQNNLAISGETSTSFRSPGGQLDAVVAAINDRTDTETVTLDIGANDLFLPFLLNPHCDPNSGMYNEDLCASERGLC